MDVALVTCAALPGLVADDRHLLHALRTRGIDVEPVVWEDRHAAWSRCRLAVVRSVWDYAYRRDAFLGWARTTAGLTELWNPLPLIEWNTHKRYLVALDDCGVSVVPTVVLRAGSTVDLAALLAAREWSDVVLKAAVAQSGRYARRVRRDRVEEGQAHLDRLLPFEDMLVQPYVPAVASSGELSIVFLDGVCTHAVRKRAAAGDFRVHDDYGGTAVVDRPQDDELATARTALAALEHAWLYARVDVVRGPAGQPMVMELELVEPELFFRCSEEAVGRMVEAIARRCEGRAM